MRDVILLPTYNERDNIEWIIKKIFDTVPSIHILVIDDNSPDKTADIVKEIMLRYPNLSILERKEKNGLGSAYIDAMSRLRDDENIRSLITMDADGSHDPEYLKLFLQNIDDWDLIIGSRYIKNGSVENWDYLRRLLSFFGNLYTRILTGLPIQDITAGFLCIKRDFIQKVNFEGVSSVGYAYTVEFKFALIHDLKARVKEIPIIFKCRRGGESKLSNDIVSEGLIAPWRILGKKIWKK